MDQRRRQRCPYCGAGSQPRCAVAAVTGRSISECAACGRVIAERQVHTHTLFPIRAYINPLPLVTPDLQTLPIFPAAGAAEDDGDPYHPTGFITAFSTFSLEPGPVLARSATSFAGHLAELERALLDSSSSSLSSSSSASASSSVLVPAGPMVSVDHLRAYLQIIDMASILGLEHCISEHAFQLFKDCSSVTCLRNRSVEALATAALVQAIREAQEPRTLQEISTASNLPQKEIGKYMKILGEALKLSQPINSNSISVHMPRFCTLLQLNKSAQELAAHIGEVVINKCFCTRRNPISISAAAIYLACQLEDKRKTQAEICKVTGLTEVTLRKVYKELLENWDDLLPPNYTPAVPPEKAFPMTLISSGRSCTQKAETLDMSHLNIHQEKDKLSDMRKPGKALDDLVVDNQGKVRDAAKQKSTSHDRSLASLYTRDLNQAAFWQPHLHFGGRRAKPVEEQRGDQCMTVIEAKPKQSDCGQPMEVEQISGNIGRRMGQTSTFPSSQTYISSWKSGVPGPSNPQ